MAALHAAQIGGSGGLFRVNEEHCPGPPGFIFSTRPAAGHVIDELGRSATANRQIVAIGLEGQNPVMSRHIVNGNLHRETVQRQS